MERQCHFCSKSFQVKSRHLEQVFCSVSCSVKARHARKVKQIKVKAIKTSVCQICGLTFAGNRKCCSDECNRKLKKILYEAYKKTEAYNSDLEKRRKTDLNRFAHIVAKSMRHPNLSSKYCNKKCASLAQYNSESKRKSAEDTEREG